MRGATLIVLAWNKWSLTKHCLDSLLASDLDQARVIVVDNGSSDETVHELNAYADRVQIVRLPENRGFVRGMNAGIAAAPADDDIVLLNNDLDFTQKDWLNRLRDAAYARADHGVIGCRLLGPAPSHRLFHLGGFIEPEKLWGQQSESGLQELEVGQFTRTRRVQSFAFAVVYLRRDCIERIGVLDESFHSYFEDTDYCLRANEAGIANVIAGNVTLRHDQHGSTQDDGGFRKRLWQQSRETFAARWQQRLLAQYRGSMLWFGLADSSSAAGHMARNLLWRLDARGLRMAFENVSKEMLDHEDFRLSIAAKRRVDALPDISLVCAPATDRAPPRGRFRCAIAHSEWDALSAQELHYYNQFDLLVVPDKFQHDLFRRCGITAPIEVIALGSDREYCHPRVPAPARPRQNFVFLCMAEEWDRDAPDVVLHAFQSAFAASDPVELIIRILPGAEETMIRTRLEALLGEQSAEVHIVAGWGFPFSQRAAWLNVADAFVSARRGAGWDPLVRDAIACGSIVIAPAYGSQQALINQYGQAVALRGTQEDPRNPGRYWANPDADALQQRMREVIADRERLRAQAEKDALAFSEAEHFDAAADRLVDVFTRRAALAPALAAPSAHRPDSLGARASGQIVVLGMHRSGTSSVGGLLALLGAWPGPEDRLLRGPDNPKGHFEHADFHMVCVRRLAAAGGDWRNVPETAPEAAVDAFRREAAEVLETLEPHRPWFIKEPRLCLFARELLPLLTRPVFVHVTRNVFDVADSLQRRDGMSNEFALALWKRYTSAAFTATEGWPRVLIDYDALMADPIGTTRRFYDELVACGIQGLNMPDESAIKAWLEPNARTATTDAAQTSPDAS